MSFFDRVRSLGSIPRQEIAPLSDMDRVKMAALAERAIVFETNELPISDQLAAILRKRAGTYQPWRIPSTDEALGVPSIFGAVTLITNTVGSLSMRALRDEVEIPPGDRPQLIRRPYPRSTPGTFYGGTTYNMARHGEAWWWVAKRDGDGRPIALVNVPPREVTVEENPRNILDPIITWRNVTRRSDDMIQIPYLLEPGELRGRGPLQMCGAAISVSVESVAWAASFYADGGNSAATIIKSAVELGQIAGEDATEAERLAEEWSFKGNNRPRVIDPRIESVEQLPFNANGAQMLEARMYQNGETARMFNMPGELVEYAMSGSSLTYQSLPTIYEDFLRRCLRPNYLSKIEAAMSDLLPRDLACRFDTDRVALADPKTRFETYQIGITTGILSVEQAQAFEGIRPGDTDNAPVPFSPPAANVPALEQRSLRELKCTCGRLAGMVSGRAEIKCSRCGQIVTAA